MKANELRIGNYVNQWWSTDKKYYVKKLDIDLLRCIIEDWTECEPIPLTEEWLVKFGFEDSSLGLNADGYERDSKLNRRRSIGLYEWDEMWFVTFREDVGINHVDLNEIDYVHQLQNLYFALTGEELTIKE